MKSNTFNKITECYVFIIICIVPLFFLPLSQIDAFKFPKAALWTVVFIIAMILLVLERLKTKEEIITGKCNEIYALLGIYLLIWIISTAFSVDKIASTTGIPLFNGLAQLILSVATFVLIINRFEFKLKYMKYVLMTYCAIAIFSVIQFYEIDPFTKYYGINVQKYIGQTFSTIGNENQVSTCLSVVYVVTAFIFIIGGCNRKIKYFYYISSMIIFAGIIATKSRASFVAIVCSFLVGLIFIIIRRGYIKSYFTVILGNIILLMVFDITNGGVTITDIMSIFSEAGNVAKGQITGDLGSDRVEIWSNSIELVKKYWLIGSGPDTFSIVYDNFGFNNNDNFGNKIKILSPHNESLRLIITTGIGSLIIYWSIVIMVMRKGISKINDNIFVIPFLLGLLCYLIKGMFNCSVITDIIMFWVLMAIIYSFNNTEQA